VSDLATWLLDRIAEDEAVAREAQGRSAYGYIDTAFEEAVDLALGEGAREVALAHIARHDPARVLAECKSKRRIVEEHTRSIVRTVKPDAPSMPELKYTSRGVEIWRPALREWHSLTQDEHNAILEAYTDPAPPPLTLRLLALPYADQDGYDPSWGVQ
jgi:hypothetical protein